MKSIYGQVVYEIMENGFRQATKYISDNLTVKCTARKNTGKQLSAVITEGKPNYAERLFIKLCKKAGEKFPVRKIQVKHWPKRKGK